MRRLLFLLVVFILLNLSASPAVAQLSDLVSVRVEPGFDGYFHEDYWLPLRVSVRNEGDAIEGELAVRPETSGRVVSNAYSVPVSLPNGAAQSVFLYVLARSFPPQLTVELLNAEGERVAQETVTISALEPQDRLHVIVTGAASEGVVLGALNPAGAVNQQVRWSVENLPDRAAALAAVDTILLLNIDGEMLTVGQVQALREWVRNDGHLIVAGGPGGVATAQPLAEWLPFVMEGTTTVDNLAALAAYVGADAADLDERAVIATGTLRDGGRILAATPSGDPLLVRDTYGAGTIDVLTADPTLAPLRGWGALPNLWFSLGASVNPYPAWGQNFLDANEAAVATAILPGVDLLPPVQSMLIFLVLYVLIIGPLNYIILSRINRRGWAWVTIPLLIVVFAGMTWTVGFNLRGGDVIISRLHVVEGWSGTDEGRLRELIGVLSPRREAYTLTMDDERLLRVMPALDEGGLLGQNITQSTADINQEPTFSAQNFTVDGGIFANFSTLGSASVPDIGGSLTLTYNADNTQSLIGAIRNDSDLILQDPILLVRGMAIQLGDALQPGDLRPINPNQITLATEAQNPIPSPLEYSTENIIADLRLSRFRAIERSNQVSANEVLGLATLTTRERDQMIDNLEESEAQIFNRRAALLNSFMRDQFGSTSRGHGAYVLGWTDDWPRDMDIVGVSWRTIDTTLYIIALDVTVEQPPSSQRVTIMPDQFTWASLERDQVETTSGPNDLLLLPNSAMSLRYMPLSDAQLAQVDEMTLRLDRSSSRGTRVEVFMWNWQTGEWDASEFDNLLSEVYTLSNPEPYLGPNNVVHIRLSLGDDIGTARIQGVLLTQTGTF